MMRIQIGEQYDKLPKIRDIIPGSLRYWVIFLLIILSICLVGVPIVLYIIWNDFSNFIHQLVFDKHQTNTKQTTHFLITDSYSYLNTKRKVSYCTYIVKPYYVLEKQIDQRSSSIIEEKQILKFLEHKSLKYQVRNQVVSQLKFKFNKTLQQYTARGLNNNQIRQYQSIFGKSNSFNVPFYSLFFDTIKRRYFRYIIMFLALLKFALNFIFFQQQSEKLTFSLIPFLVGITLAGNLLLDIFGSYLNKTSNICLQQAQYNVIRQGRQLSLTLKQIVVGDIIKLKQNQTIWFKGIYITQNSSKVYMVINTSLFDHYETPLIKFPLLHSIHQIGELNIIQPGSKVLSLAKTNASTIQSNISRSESTINHFLIVTQISYIEKYFKEYSSFKTYSNFESYRNQYDISILIFAAINFAVIFAIFLVFFAITNHQINLKFILNLLLIIVILSFPFQTQFFNFVTTLFSVVRLKTNEVKIIRPILEQIGLIQALTTELSIFKKTQFNSFLKKQGNFGLQPPTRLGNFQSWIQAYDKTKSKSLFAFFLYCGAMNVDKINSDPIKKMLFDFFHFHYINQEEEVQRTRIRNQQFIRIRKIKWKIIKRFQLNSKYQHSVLIKDQFQNKYLLVLEGYYLHDGCDEFFKSVIVQKRNQYLTSMKQYLQKGKIVRYICFKQNILENDVQDDNFSIQSSDLYRSKVQKNLTYAGIVIYDQWPKTQTLEVMERISNASSQKNSNLQCFFISNSEQSQIFGFDHQFQNRCFLFDQSSAQRTKLIRQIKMNKGVMHCGKGMLDQAALLAADISIQFQNQSPAQADILIKQILGIQNVIQEGRWTFETIKLSIIFLTLVNFTYSLGNAIYYYFVGATYFQKSSLFYIFGIILPCLFLNFYSPLKISSLFQNKFLNYFLTLNASISIMALFTFYLINWTDLCNICQSKSNTTHFSSHLSLRFASHNKESTLTNIIANNDCQNFLNFTTLSVGLLLIIILDRQSYARQAHVILRHINKAYMIIVWIFFGLNFSISFRIMMKIGITILILSIIVYLFLSIKKENNQKCKKMQIDSILQEQNQNQVNAEQTHL